MTQFELINTWFYWQTNWNGGRMRCVHCEMTQFILHITNDHWNVANIAQKVRANTLEMTLGMSFEIKIFKQKCLTLTLMSFHL